MSSYVKRQRDRIADGLRSVIRQTEVCAENIRGSMKGCGGELAAAGLEEAAAELQDVVSRLENAEIPELPAMLTQV